MYRQVNPQGLRNSMDRIVVKEDDLRDYIGNENVGETEEDIQLVAERYIFETSIPFEKVSIDLIANNGNIVTMFFQKHYANYMFKIVYSSSPNVFAFGFTYEKKSRQFTSLESVKDSEISNFSKSTKILLACRYVQVVMKVMEMIGYQFDERLKEKPFYDKPLKIKDRSFRGKKKPVVYVGREYRYKGDKTFKNRIREYHRIIESWNVRGHWREYKNGNKVWIKPYKKGDGKLVNKDYLLTKTTTV